MGHLRAAKSGQNGAGQAGGGRAALPAWTVGEGGKTRREKPGNQPCGWVRWGVLAIPDAR
jgi:hypothetical protein